MSIVYTRSIISKDMKISYNLYFHLSDSIHSFNDSKACQMIEDYLPISHRTFVHLIFF